MPKRMLIDAAHAEETRVVVVDGSRIEDFDFESQNRKQLRGTANRRRTRLDPLRVPHRCQAIWRRSRTLTVQNRASGIDDRPVARRALTLATNGESPGPPPRVFPLSSPAAT